jgi:hypothetical protein
MTAIGQRLTSGCIGAGFTAMSAMGVQRSSMPLGWSRFSSISVDFNRPHFERLDLEVSAHQNQQSTSYNRVVPEADVDLDAIGPMLRLMLGGPWAYGSKQDPYS